MKIETLSAARHFPSVLGALGTVICLAASLGVWYVESRVDLARKQLFERVDQCVTSIDGRLIAIQKVVAKSKITFDEIQQHIDDWTKQEASERLSVRFDLEAKLQRLIAGVRQAEGMLEISRETVQHIRHILNIGADIGLSMNADFTLPLLERIADIQKDLSQAIDTAEHLVQFIGDDRDDQLRGGRAEQLATIAGRLLATFGTVDSRVESFRDRLTNAQEALREVSSKTHARIVFVSVCATLFLLWMAAGQICLWRWARNC